MKIIKNSGSERVIDELRKCLTPQGTLDIASPTFSLFAFGEIQELLSKLTKCRVVVPASDAGDLSLVGTTADRTYRNRLQLRWLAKQCAFNRPQSDFLLRVALLNGHILEFHSGCSSCKS